MIDVTASNIFMCIGFLISLYACISNDIIQTLGTFLQNTRHRPLWLVWLYASGIIITVLTIGWALNSGDMAFHRLDKIPFPDVIQWWQILPPIILICLTRNGIPAATSFLIVSIFSSNTVLGLMITKSVVAYGVALIVSFIVYFLIARRVEKIFLYTKNRPTPKGWIAAKWISTAFLLSAWLMQDGAVLYVFLPRHLTLSQMLLSYVALVIILYFICAKRGGNLAGIIKLKTNTQDVRSATIIDIIFGIILVSFMFGAKIPLSTTWVFLGVLGGREIALYNRLRYITEKKVYKHVIKDLTKALLGLAISVGVVSLLCHYDKIVELIKTCLNL